MIDRRTLTGALAAAATATLMPRLARAADIAKARNIVLVHGLFADGSCWTEVIPLLQGAGLNVTAVQNPLTTLPEAVASAERVLDRQETAAPGQFLRAADRPGRAIERRAGYAERGIDAAGVIVGSADDDVGYAVAIDVACAGNGEAREIGIRLALDLEALARGQRRAEIDQARKLRHGVPPERDRKLRQRIGRHRASTRKG